MPKIVINEYDKTKAGLNSYTNFSVVVPGFIGTPSDPSISSEDVEALFDENGIYECNSKTDFEKYIGKVSYMVPVEKSVAGAVAPKVSVAIYFDENAILQPDSANAQYDIAIEGVCRLRKNSTSNPIEADYTVTYTDSAKFREAMNKWHNKEIGIPTSLTHLKDLLLQVHGQPENTTPVYTLGDSFIDTESEIDGHAQDDLDALNIWGPNPDLEDYDRQIRIQVASTAYNPKSDIILQLVEITNSQNLEISDIPDAIATSGTLSCSATTEQAPVTETAEWLSSQGEDAYEYEEAVLGYLSEADRATAELEHRYAVVEVPDDATSITLTIDATLTDSYDPASNDLSNRFLTPVGELTCTIDQEESSFRASATIEITDEIRTKIEECGGLVVVDNYADNDNAVLVADSIGDLSVVIARAPSSGTPVAVKGAMSFYVDDTPKDYGVRLVGPTDENYDTSIIYPLSTDNSVTRIILQKINTEGQTAAPGTLTFKVYSAANNVSGQIGYLKDEDRVYTALTALSGNSVAKVASYTIASNLDDGGTANFGADLDFDKNAYYLIKEEAVAGSYANKGTDGVVITEDVVHYGNQIANELLGLGYTVLYKKINKVNIQALIDAVQLEADASRPAATTAAQQREKFIEDNCDEETYYAEDGTTALGKLYTIKKDSKLTSLSVLGDDSFWECLKDKATYDFRYIVTGLMDNNDSANTAIIALAHQDTKATGSTGRGDCIALVDIDRSLYTGESNNTQAAAVIAIGNEANKYQSKYAAIFAPDVTYTMVADKDFGNNRTFPGSFHYLACAAKSAENFNEWYANAGYTRGVANYTIESVGCKLGEVAIQALEPRCATKLGDKKNDPTVETSVNLIVKIKNSYYLWGNRTAHKLGAQGATDGDLVASHFLNIRQLCTTIKKEVYVACRRFTFDPNSVTLWLNFCGAIRPTLEKMKADQGVRDYRIVQNKTSQKGVLSAKIRIIPIEAVEDFYIDLFLEDSISGPDAQVAESE